FFSSRRRHTRFSRDWSSDVCSSDLHAALLPWLPLLERGGLARVAVCTDGAPERLPRPLLRRVQRRGGQYHLLRLAIRRHRAALERTDAGRLPLLRQGAARHQPRSEEHTSEL